MAKPKYELDVTNKRLSHPLDELFNQITKYIERTYGVTPTKKEISDLSKKLVDERLK